MVKIGSNPRNRCTHILYSLLNPVNESKTVESIAFFLRECFNFSKYPK